MFEIIIGTVMPWLVVLCILVVILYACFVVPKTIIAFSKFSLTVRIILILTLIGGALVRFYMVPSYHRIYFDEDRYLAYAVSFARFNKAISLDAATPAKSIIGKPDQAVRLTVPVINGLVLKIFGYSEAALFNAARVFSVIHIVLIFILAYLLFKNTVAALFSALGMAFLPLSVYWAASTTLDPYFVFFSTLTLLASHLYTKKPSRISAVFLSTVIFLLLCVRLEAFFFLPVVIVAIVIMRSSQNSKILLKSDAFLISLILPLILIRSLASLSVLTEKWCCAEALPLEAFALHYGARNILPNLGVLFTRPEFPLFVSVLAIVSLFGIKDRKIIILGLWTGIFFLVYSFYYAGRFYSYEFSGSYGRYFLMLVPPMLILAGLSFDDLVQWILSHKKRQSLLILLITALVVINIQAIINYTRLIATSPYFNLVEKGPHTTHTVLTEYVIPQTPQNSIVIHPLTAYTLLSGRTAIYYGSFMKERSLASYVKQEIRRGTPVFMIQAYECDLFPEKCKNILPYFEFKPATFKRPLPKGFEMLRVYNKDASQSAK